MFGTASAGTLGQRAKNVVSDAFIYAAVRARLADVDVDSTSTVHVAVNHGVVTLTGHASSGAERDAYVNTTWKVGGVTDVHSELTINSRPGGVSETARDDALAVRVYAALVSQAGGNAFHVTAHARDGIVTLRGAVPSHSVENTMVATAERVSGVRGVVDDLTVH
jgi:osmotically-inducible protein OsmY